MPTVARKTFSETVVVRDSERMHKGMHMFWRLRNGTSKCSIFWGQPNQYLAFPSILWLLQLNSFTLRDFNR